MGSKWLELLKQVAPHVTRVAMIYNPATVPYEFVRQLEAIGPSLGLQPIHVPILPLSPQRLAQVEAELRLLG